MKRILLALFFAIYLPSSALAASDSATMDVSLNNVASVFVSTTPIDFGDVGTADLVVGASGSITVNATIDLPYNIAIDGGLNPKVTGICRQMTGEASREYELFDGSEPWGDADFDNTCAGSSTANLSKASIGTGADQTHTVDAIAQSGFSIGSMSDTLTVTVYY